MSEKKIPDGRELVEVTLFSDGEKYKDDVYVCVNGDSCLIRRGVPVKIERRFAQVLEASQEQDRFAESLMRRTASRAPA